MRISTTDDFAIKKEYYYIVDFRNYNRIKIYPVYYISRRRAQASLDNSVRELKKRRHKYEVVSGRKLIRFKLPYIFMKKFRSRKYDYPEKNLEYQKRKSYRTKIRRRLRRMDLNTNIKVKMPVNGARQIVKLRPNKQKVANSPNTIARVFRLDRKPAKYYYFMIRKIPTKIKGLLLKMKVVRLNIKTGELKGQVINIKRTDLIIPYILTEIRPLIKKIDNLDYIIKKLALKGFKI